jgi:hypothetical protein
MVSVRAVADGDSWRCEVNVDQADERTHHVVMVRPADLERWASGTDANDVHDLVARSFDFLLEREPPNSILATFELSVIQRYFPEYDRIFAHR